MALATRVARIISRFPRHWEADGAGKVFNTVVGSLALELEIKSAQSGRVRHAHRLRFAEERRDILLLAGLHGFAPQHFGLGQRRRQALQKNAVALADDSLDAAAYTEARRLLSALVAVSPQDLAPQENDPDPTAGYHARLAAAIAKITGFKEELDEMRWQVRCLIDVHRHGNGTIAALLRATAAYLYLEAGSIMHSIDGYGHLCRCYDRYAFSLPEVAAPNALPAYNFPTKADFLAVEENPLVDSEREPVARSHGQLFTIDRNGFDPVTVSVHVVGCGETTLNPMVVNQWTGEGVWYNGIVPDGQMLIFAADGNVTLEGADVSEFAYSFRGAVFADADARDELHDFRFGDDAAGEAEQAETVSGLCGNAPGTGRILDRSDAAPWSRASRKTRSLPWAAVAGGHSSRRPITDRPAPPPATRGLPYPSTMPESQEDRYLQDWAKTPVVAKVGFSWKEREAFSIIVWIPDRFAVLDTADQPTVAGRLEDLARSLSCDRY